MALVDYASSDENSEDEVEVKEQEKPADVKINDAHSSSATVKVINTSKTEEDKELFSTLPKPKKSFTFLDDENRLSKLLLSKSDSPLSQKKSVKITVPSISDFEEESEPVVKKLKPSVKGAGLFSVLPPPKNTARQSTKIFIPQAVTKVQVKKSVNKEIVQKSENNSLLKIKNDEEDEDDESAIVGSSFFGSSLESKNSHPKSESVDINNSLIQEQVTNEIPVLINETELPKSHPGPTLISNEVDSSASNTYDVMQSPEIVSAADNPLDLDEKALQILCGNKKKRHQMPMNIINLSSDEVLPDSKEWLLKQFTEEKRSSSVSHKKSHGFSSQSKRKHQITYLAYQAKEQELELQNQWANNRMSRKQTQSKYGF